MSTKTTVYGKGTRRPALWVTKKFVLNFRKHHEIPEYDGLVIMEALEIAHDWLAMDRIIRSMIPAAINLHQTAPWKGDAKYMRALKALDRAVSELPSGIYDSAVSDSKGNRPLDKRGPKRPHTGTP